TSSIHSSLMWQTLRSGVEGAALGCARCRSSALALARRARWHFIPAWGTLAAVAAVTDRTHSTVVLHVGEQYRGSEKLVVEKALRSRLGVIEAEANPAAQTATVTYDPSVTSVEELRRLVEACGFQCAGGNVPGCI